MNRPRHRQDTRPNMQYLDVAIHSQLMIDPVLALPPAKQGHLGRALLLG